MRKQEKLSKDTMRQKEDHLKNFVDSLDEFERATLYTILHAEGMDRLRAWHIRVQAGAVS